MQKAVKREYRASERNRTRRSLKDYQASVRRHILEPNSRNTFVLGSSDETFLKPDLKYSRLEKLRVVRDEKVVKKLGLEKKFNVKPRLSSLIPVPSPPQDPPKPKPTAGKVSSLPMEPPKQKPASRSSSFRKPVNSLAELNTYVNRNIGENRNSGSENQRKAVKFNRGSGKKNKDHFDRNDVKDLSPMESPTFPSDISYIEPVSRRLSFAPDDFVFTPPESVENLFPEGHSFPFKQQIASVLSRTSTPMPFKVQRTQNKVTKELNGKNVKSRIGATMTSSATAATEKLQTILKEDRQKRLQQSGKAKSYKEPFHSEQAQNKQGQYIVSKQFLVRKKSPIAHSGSVGNVTRSSSNINCKRSTTDKLGSSGGKSTDLGKPQIVVTARSVKTQKAPQILDQPKTVSTKDIHKALEVVKKENGGSLNCCYEYVIPNLEEHSGDTTGVLKNPESEVLPLPLETTQVIEKCVSEKNEKLSTPEPSIPLTKKREICKFSLKNGCLIPNNAASKLQVLLESELSSSTCLIEDEVLDESLCRELDALELSPPDRLESVSVHPVVSREAGEEPEIYETPPECNESKKDLLQECAAQNDEGTGENDRGHLTVSESLSLKRDGYHSSSTCRPQNVCNSKNLKNVTEETVENDDIRISSIDSSIMAPKMFSLELSFLGTPQRSTYGHNGSIREDLIYFTPVAR